MQNFAASDINELNDLPPVSQSDYLMPTEFDDGSDEFDILLEWEDEADGDEWDEPEPLAEYDNELRQPLYVIDDAADDELDSELQIDQWIAALGGLRIADRYFIKRLLTELGRNRLLRWLPWLSKQQWTGKSLLLFLRFRKAWEANPHWWEYSYWDWRARCWYPTRSRHSLSLDDTYELVHCRLDHQPGEIIDKTWLSDWLSMNLWQRGFRSFASFALFRAGFAGDENWQRYNWQRYMGSYVPDDSGDTGMSEQWNNSHRLYCYGPPLWFAEQNWYDPGEWHDNLGW